MKVHKKAKFKKVRWLLVSLAAVLIIFVLLLYKPGGYNPPDFAHSKEVSPYLTHELLPQLYNGTQLEEPFDLSVSQAGINDIIVRSKWPKEFDGIRFFAPEVFFAADSIMVMGTIVVSGVEFVATVMVDASLDQEGLLNLRVAKVKVGAMSITPLAKVIARKMYQKRFAATDIDTEDLRVQIAASLLNSEPFEPVFKVEGKKVRAEKITITQGKLTVRLVPAYD